MVSFESVWVGQADVVGRGHREPRLERSHPAYRRADLRVDHVRGCDHRVYRQSQLYGDLHGEDQGPARS